MEQVVIMRSVWNETADKMQTRPAINGDITTDALVVGGGMFGILIAHILK